MIVRQLLHFAASTLLCTFVCSLNADLMFYHDCSSGYLLRNSEIFQEYVRQRTHQSVRVLGILCLVKSPTEVFDKVYVWYLLITLRGNIETQTG